MPMRLLRRAPPLPSPSGGEDDGARHEATAVPLAPAGYHGDPARGRLITESGRHVELGRYATAFATIRQALQASPDDPELLFAKATILLAWGRHREARAAGSMADALGCRHSMRALTLGWICYWGRDVAGAENWMRKAVASDSANAAAHFGLGIMLQAQKKHVEAIAAFERALELSPDNEVCRTNIGVCLIDHGDIAAAESHFRRVTAAQPENAKGWANLGVALGRLDRYGEALEAFERAESLTEAGVDQTDNLVNLAIHLRDEQRTADALAVCERMLARTASIDGHYLYALALLTAGRLLEGWREYEFRWLREPLLSQRPRYPVPLWDGQDIRGKTILISAEQGFGDTIQLARYAPYFRAMGATVLFQVQRGLETLAKGFAGVDHVLGRDETAAAFDFRIHALSLPRVLRTDLASIPCEIPYLRASSDRVARWAPRLAAAGRINVGLVWSGNPGHLRDQYRSIPLPTLAPLLDLERVSFISLQKGPAESEIEALGPQARLMNLGAELEDFADTAAIVDQLDLVICVDTAIAHLAGAMAKPVWLLLPRPADWRWLEEREDSPWYPTMRLFRQGRRMDWTDVVTRVAVALQQLTGANPHPSRDPDRTSRSIARHAGSVDMSARVGPGAGFSAVAEMRGDILQYLPEDGEIGESIRLYGEYLQPQLDFLLRLVRPGSTIVEAGSGVGAHALPLAGAAGEAGQVFLYEARPKMRQMLEQNLAANRVTNATVMKRALGSQGEPAAAPVESGSTTPGATAAIGITTETLDELGLERLTWLKVNESVSALDILGGASESLWRLRPLLFLSAPDDAAIAALAAKAREFSYRCWTMRTAYFNPNNFNRRANDVFPGRAALVLVAIPEEMEADIALDGCVEIP